MQRPRSISAAASVALAMALTWSCAHPAWAEPVATPPSRRLQHPLTVSGVASFPVFNLGVDVSYQLSDRFAIGGQLASTFLVHNDLSARARFFILTWPDWGIYLGANAHGIASPILLSTPAWAGTLELGVEIQTEGRWIFGFGAGGGYLWAEEAEGRGPDESNWMLWPTINLRIGRALE